MVVIILFICGKGVSPKKMLIDFFNVNFSFMLRCLSMSNRSYVPTTLSYIYIYIFLLIVPHIYLLFSSFKSFLFYFSLPKMSVLGLLVKSYLYFAADIGWPTQKN